ncbi:phosphopantothenate/pantothenate synthetase [Lyngbya aestuarii]|uniref:phosphopantothenate/pantothenate synthetase n=1 Tax=Lyngbya aestuarii TaxID=118322 RepID=UPI00403E1015
MSDVPASHPRALSLKLREQIEHYRKVGLVADAGPIAHGRGEAFDYLLGEATPEPVVKDIYAAAALLLEAEHPVISVNGNTAVLAPQALISLANKIPAKLEVNVFYGRTQEREKKIAEYLISQGAQEVLGVNSTAKVPHLHSSRGQVDKNGIAAADVVLVGLEDGDRTRALLAWGKKVISIDLNPLSRTAIDATLNICDNVIRALPLLETAVEDLRGDEQRRKKIIAKINSKDSTARVLQFLDIRLKSIAHQISELSVLEATEAHLNFIVDLINSVIEEGCFDLEKDKLSLEAIISKLNAENSAVYVLVSQNNLCGFVDAEILEEGYLQVANLAIAKNYRGLGGGQLLLKKIEELASNKGCDKVVIRLLASCRAAQALFLKQGYTPHGFIALEKGDLIVMGKKIE